MSGPTRTAQVPQALPKEPNVTSRTRFTADATQISDAMHELEPGKVRGRTAIIP